MLSAVHSIDQVGWLLRFMNSGIDTALKMLRTFSAGCGAPTWNGAEPGRAVQQPHRPQRASSAEPDQECSPHCTHAALESES